MRSNFFKNIYLSSKYLTQYNLQTFECNIHINKLLLMQFYLINIRPELHHQKWRKFRVTLPAVNKSTVPNMSTVPNFLNFTSSLLMLFFVQPLSGNSVINCRALSDFWSKFCLLLNGVKVAAFAWYSVKIRAIFGVRLERRKVEKSKPASKLKQANSILESLISSKLFLIISSYKLTVWKLVHFLRHNVHIWIPKKGNYLATKHQRDKHANTRQ